MSQRYFTPKLFSFMQDLADNNDRDWFKANQDRFEQDVREPALDFITDFSKPLESISKHFVADSRKVGGSLFRIQRDTRFSKDKTPYKTHVGIHFRHFATKEDVHAPGFYLHLEPGGSFAGLGLWRPSATDANEIRQKIADESARWRRAAHDKRFTETYSLEGESLVRPPKGFEGDHPLIEDIKRKDFLGSTQLAQQTVTSSGFFETYVDLCKAGAPFMKFLCEAVGVGF